MPQFGARRVRLGTGKKPLVHHHDRKSPIGEEYLALAEGRVRAVVWYVTVVYTALVWIPLDTVGTVIYVIDKLTGVT